MARIRNLRTYWQWRGFSSGEWASCDVDLTSVESNSTAGVLAAAAAAVAPLLPPGPFLAAVIAAHAAQIVASKGPLGVTVSITTPLLGAVVPIATIAGTSIGYFAIGGEGSLIKKESGPEVDVVLGGQRHWIINPAVFNAHGYSWNSIVGVTDAEFNSIPKGADIT